MVPVTLRDKLLLLVLGDGTMLTHLVLGNKGVGAEAILPYEHVPWRQPSDLVG